VATSSQSSYQEILSEAWEQHLAPRAQDAPTVISLFAGAGGSSLGYSMAGYRELLAVEWDANAVETFKLNFPGVPVYHGDIAKLSVEDVLEQTGLQPGELDVLDGSPPCQGFSTAGKRDMADDRNQLFREYVRLLRGLRPKVFVMENVSGMVKGKMKLIFVEILKELKASGYKVSVRLMNAMYFHVPQSRQRLIFIGVREDVDSKPEHPKAEGGGMDGSKVVPELQGKRFLSWRNAGKKDTLRARGALPCGIAKTGIPLEGRKLYRDPEGIKLFFSFPKPYVFCGKQQDQLDRLGNSVPPLLIRSVAQHLRKTVLDGVTP
jgi:DNA (cytosine-5)-methyltransferase 1